MANKLEEVVYVGLNSRVAALDRDSGRTLWDWRAPKPNRGYVSLLLLDGKRLIASVNGYTYCLDPETGRQLWYNELPGFGSGVTSLAAVGRHSSYDQLLAAAEETAARAAAAS